MRRRPRREWDWVPMVDVFPKDEKKGEAVIQRFEVSNKESSFTGLRAMFNARSHDYVPPGKYVRLGVGGVFMMSDTRMEKDTSRSFIDSANGRVLVAGLGLGVALLPVLLKKKVKEVIVVEKSKDVIDLVTPRLLGYLDGRREKNNGRLRGLSVGTKLINESGKRSEIVHGDIFEFKVPKGIKFDTIFLDIWSDICEDNLEDIRLLKNKFKNRINRGNPNFFFRAWEEEELRRMRRRERHRSYPFGF